MITSSATLLHAVEQPRHTLTTTTPAATDRPRAVCLDHSTYQAGCGECRTNQAAYKRWRRRQRAYGRLQHRVDATRARAHLKAMFVDYRLTTAQAEMLCGLPHTFLFYVASGRTTTIPPAHEAAIVSIDAHQAISEAPNLTGFITSRGAARRLQALMAIGYSDDTLSPHLQVTAAAVSRWRRRTAEHIRVHHHRRVAAAYHQLHTRPGPDVTAAVEARQLQYAPPICWDDDHHLDKPAGRPLGYRRWLELHPDPRDRAGAA